MRHRLASPVPHFDDTPPGVVEAAKLLFRIALLWQGPAYQVGSRSQPDD